MGKGGCYKDVGPLDLEFVILNRLARFEASKMQA